MAARAYMWLRMDMTGQRYIDDCLDSEGIQRLGISQRTFSRSKLPIENVWDAMGGKLMVETIVRQTRTPSSSSQFFLKFDDCIIHCPAHPTIIIATFLPSNQEAPSPTDVNIEGL
ncbi:hypothetical protein TNCV_770291 [Trichonephila clavipes]|nr:hypothetical protein TNCV_770291 [Trichonephila clavipes]